MMTTSTGSGRPQLVYASTDPVVVGLGRLLIGVGVLTLAGMLMLAWLILRGIGAA